MNKRGISLVGINDITTLELIRTNYENSWFELSYASTKEQLHEQLPIIKDRIASIHMLCPQREYFPKLLKTSSFLFPHRNVFIFNFQELKYQFPVLITYH